MKSIELVTKFLSDYEDLLFKVSEVDPSDLEELYNPLVELLAEAIAELSTEKVETFIAKLDEQRKKDDAELLANTTPPPPPVPMDELHQLKIVESFNSLAAGLVSYKNEAYLEELFKETVLLSKSLPSNSPIAIYVGSFISKEAGAKSRRDGGEKIVTYIKGLDPIDPIYETFYTGIGIYLSETSMNKAMKAMGNYYESLI